MGNTTYREQMKTKWLKAEYLEGEVRQHIRDVTTVLDIGCGIVPQRYVRSLIHICCEPHKEYLQKLQDKLKDTHDRNYLFVNATWQEAVRLFPPKSVDTVFLLDVIEHLKKSEAKKLINQTEKIARRQIIIFTPLGFASQHSKGGKDAWGLGGGTWQEHKSGWQPEDFGDGWKVFATKKFHIIDTLKKIRKKPVGAIFAIRDLEKPEPDLEKAANELCFKAVDAHSLAGLKISIIFFSSWKKGKEVIWTAAKYFIKRKS